MTSHSNGKKCVEFSTGDLSRHKFKNLRLYDLLVILKRNLYKVMGVVCVGLTLWTFSDFCEDMFLPNYMHSDVISRFFDHFVVYVLDKDDQ